MPERSGKVAIHGMKKILLTYTFLLFILSLSAQITFQKKYNINSATIKDGLQLPNGNYAVAYDEAAGDIKGGVFIAGPFGEIVWAEQISTAAQSRVHKIAASKQNDIYLLADIWTDLLGQAKLILIKLNTDGQIIWSIYLGENINRSQDMLVDEAGDILVTRNLPFDDSRCIKINASGNILWAKKYGVNAPSNITQIIENKENDYWLLGSGEHPLAAGQDIVHLLKISPDGEPLFSKSYDFSHPINIAVFSNNEMTITGFVPNDNREFIMKINAAGDILWANIMDSPFNIAGAYVTNEDDIFLSGIYDGPGIVSMMKMNRAGEINWERGYVGGYTGFRQGFETESGFAVLGKFISSDERESLFYKTDKNGLISGCGHFNICSNLEPLHIDTTSFIWTASGFIINTDFEINMQPAEIMAEDICAPAIVPSPFFNVPDTICQNTCITLNGLSQANADSWKWLFTGATPSFSALQNPGEICYENTGSFQIQHIIQFAGCYDTLLAGLTVVPVPQLDLGKDTLLCNDEILELNAAVPEINNYIWDDGFTGPRRDIMEEGTYRAEAVFPYCEVSDSIFVGYQNCNENIYVPTAFSPNGDGINDRLEIFTEGVEILKTKVFNRWGGLVYSSPEGGGNWDGTFKGDKLQVGVYVYLIEYRSLVSGNKKIKAGEVLLMR